MPHAILDGKTNGRRILEGRLKTLAVLFGVTIISGHILENAVQRASIRAAKPRLEYLS
jgi:hypothetical protein